MWWPRYAIFCWVLLGYALAAPLRAAEPFPEAPAVTADDDLHIQVQRLQQRIEELERAAGVGTAQLEFLADEEILPAAAESPAAGQSAEGKKPSAADDWVDLSNEKWTVKLGGHMQADFVEWAKAEDPPVPAKNYFEFRRLRLLADGTGYGVYDFRIQIDVEPEAGEGVTSPVVDIKDAYLTMNDVAVLQRVRFGNFFVPFGLEQVTNDTNNIFLERSIPTQNVFTADREVGTAVYGAAEDLDFTWTFGAFIDNISDSIKERVDDNQGSRFSGRLTWLPYYDEPSNGRYLVHLGTGVLYTHEQDEISRYRSRPQIHEGPFLIDTGNMPATSTTSVNVEFATVWSNISVQSELYATSVNRIDADAAMLYGGYLYASYFLTGENRIYERWGQHGAQFARNVPFTNFFLTPGGYGSGAVEAKARVSYLDFSNVQAGQYTDFTVGFNWYWTERIRIMFDWIHPMTTAQAQPYGGTTSDIIGTRFDFNF